MRGSETRLNSVMALTDSQYRNVGEDEALEMKILEVIIGETNNKKIIQACKEMKSEVRQNQASDHENSLRPNKLASLSYNFIKTAAVSEAQVESISKFLKDLQSLIRIKVKETPTIPSLEERTCSEWSASANNTLGWDGAHLEYYYRANPDKS